MGSASVTVKFQLAPRASRPPGRAMRTCRSVSQRLPSVTSRRVPTCHAMWLIQVVPSRLGAGEAANAQCGNSTTE